MPSKKISQREARELRRRVARLENHAEQKTRIWAQDWPGGVNITHVILDDVTHAKVETARKLGCALVATLRGETGISINAVKP